MANKSTLGFYGGAGTVTGANFLLKNDDISLLVDCGLNQSRELCDHCNYDEFKYDPSEVEFLFITHAHLDHIGRIPKLVKEGFRGVIYSTPSTLEMATIMFQDGVSLLSREAKKLKREPLYDAKDVQLALSLWKTVKYHTHTELKPGYSFYYKDAGHIMGSVITEITHEKDGHKSKIAFTGDLGNSPTPLLRDTDPVTDADYMVMESVYGDRNHETTIEERTNKLEEVIKESIARGGVLMIPVFSIERTQVILHELNNLIEDGKVPSVPVYLDSPLAIKVTKIYGDYSKNFNDDIQEEIRGGDDIFDFPKLNLTLTADQSKAIKYQQGPKIIMAGSGMSHGGRIMHHERMYLGDPKNTILFVGYQVPGTPGRQIQDGNGVVNLFGKDVKIRAQIRTISGYSAHKDSEHLTEFAGESARTLKKVFVAMGEPKAALFLAQRLKDYHEIDAVVPKEGDVYDIDF